MYNILTIIPGQVKTTKSGWHSFNAVCCHNRGHRVDTRFRGGLKIDGNNWLYHCFNCQYTCSFEYGRFIDDKTSEMLKWCGMEQSDINRWSFDSRSHRHILDLIPKAVVEDEITFPPISLPNNSEFIDKANPKHARYIEYLESRKIDPLKYPFCVTPYEKGRNNNRIIVPYTYKNEIVGHTSRFMDNRLPKYLNDQSPGYVFGYDLQHPEWQVCILMEGIFDALSIDGCATMHETISPSQAKLLATLKRKIIVVPDYDKSGLSMISKAQEYGYSISLPNWGEGVKDVNDAVVRYGKLPTVLAILEAATTSKILIEMKRQRIAARI